LAIVLPAAAQRSSTPKQPAASGPIRLEPPLICCAGKSIPEHPIPFANPDGQLPVTPIPPAGKPMVVPISSTGSALPPHAGDLETKGPTNTSSTVKTAPVREPLPAKLEKTDAPPSHSIDNPL
jgi:hypothetical protein